MSRALRGRAAVAGTPAWQKALSLVGLAGPAARKVRGQRLGKAHNAELASSMNWYTRFTSLGQNTSRERSDSSMVGRRSRLRYGAQARPKSLLSI
jgi:hypothetical protein